MSEDSRDPVFWRFAFARVWYLAADFAHVVGSLRRVLLPLVFSAGAKRPRVSLRHRSKVHEILLFVGFTEHVNRRHHRWGDFRDHATSSRKRHHGEQFAATIRHRLAVVLEFLPILRFLPSGVYSHVQVDISTPWGDLLHRQYLFTVLLRVHANEKR